MNSEMRLLKNTGILVLGNISIRVLSFLLVPLYTSALSTSEYSLYELIFALVSLLIPVLTLDIVDSVLRFSLDPSNDIRQVFPVALKYVLVGFGFVFVLLLANRALKLASFLIGNELVFFLMFAESCVIQILSAFGKGLNKLKETAIAGVIGALVTTILTIILLIPLKAGIHGYFFSFLAGYAVQILYLVLNMRGFLWNFVQTIDKRLEKEMLKYSIPLIANNVAWWVNNALDRYILTYLCGMAVNGIYSIAYKIPTTINMVQSMFHQAWTLSAVQEYTRDKSRLFFSSVYRKYQFLLVSLCSTVILLNQPIARFMYAYEFYDAWRFVPLLCISFVFLGLSNYVGGIFNALKKPHVIAKTTVIGAVLNGVLNILLIPRYSAYGAAVATCLSYVAVWLLRLIFIRKEMQLNLMLAGDVVSYLILLAGSLYVFDDNWVFATLKYAMIPLLFLIYRNEISELFNMARKRIDIGRHDSNG